MAHSYVRYTAKETPQLPARPMRVLVTGASGSIGSSFAEQCRGQFELRLQVRDLSSVPDTLENLGEWVSADLGDPYSLRSACRGIDAVLHLAAEASPSATWEELIEPNILGLHRMLEAARLEGVRKIIYASSIHAVSGYPGDMQIRTTDPVNPGDLYGVTKCLGEAMVRYYSSQHGMSALVVRIGAFQPIAAARQEDAVGMLDIFASHRDLVALLRACLLNQTLKFAILHGISDNSIKRLDLSDTCELVNYAPEDDSTRELPQLAEVDLANSVKEHNQMQPG